MKYHTDYSNGVVMMVVVLLSCGIAVVLMLIIIVAVALFVLCLYFYCILSLYFSAEFKQKNHYFENSLRDFARINSV